VDFAADPSTLLLLLGAATLAGFVDAIAGGGGLITLPALLVAGVSPLGALGTNKAQSVFGSGTASVTLLRKRMVTVTEVAPPFVRAAIGSAVGALVVRQFDTDSLDIVIPAVLVLIGGYFLFVPSVGELESTPRLSVRVYRNTVVPAIGAYDGLLGPGTGSFFAVSGVALRGLHLVKATAVAKTLNFASNAAALAVFIVGGEVVWEAALVMMGGQAIGAFVGAHTMVRGGTRLIRPMVVVMSAAMLVRYFAAS
jgi:uncharacterized membrane protein YfcA